MRNQNLQDRTKRFALQVIQFCEEADECGYWIELLVESGKSAANDAAPLMSEANELVAICISSITTAKRNLATED